MKGKCTLRIKNKCVIKKFTKRKKEMTIFRTSSLEEVNQILGKKFKQEILNEIDHPYNSISGYDIALRINDNKNTVTGYILLDADDSTPELDYLWGEIKVKMTDKKREELEFKATPRLSWHDDEFDNEGNTIE